MDLSSCHPFRDHVLIFLAFLIGCKQQTHRPFLSSLYTDLLQATKHTKWPWAIERSRLPLSAIRIFQDGIFLAD